MTNKEKTISSSKILVTGAAGFIGFHVVKKLLSLNYNVIGLDNINDYYDVTLKYRRLQETGINKDSIEWGVKTNSQVFNNYSFIRINIEDNESIMKLFEAENFDHVVHLAAQAGVRYSLQNPYAYINSNINGFLSILEACRHKPVKHLVYASTSSVYGANTNMPFSEHENTDHPISFYAATKKANEVMAHSYSSLYNIKTTGLRFFTVYGPWGRPDMALFLFTKAILEDKPIQVFNNGNMQRDFTYVDDIVNGICKALFIPAEPDKTYDNHNPDPATSYAPYKIYNIGNSRPNQLLDFISAIEKILGKQAKKEMLPMQAGDVPKTWADVSGLNKLAGYKPSTGIEEGIKNFLVWYKDYYNIR